MDRLPPSLASIAAGVLLACVIATIIVETVDAGPNETAVLPLHAVVDPATPIPCDIGDPCDPGPATVNIPPANEIAVYLLLRSHSNVVGLQTAFEWNGWSLIGGRWDCQSNQVIGTEPHGAGGPTDGSIATAFDCILGPETAVIGALRLVAGSSGCVSQVASSYPFGTHLVSCTDEIDPVPPERWGAVCVEQGGIDACGGAVPVFPICDAGGPYEGFAFHPVTFDGSGSSDPDGFIVSYDWTFGDGSTGQGAITTHAYSYPSLFTVTLCVTDDASLTSCCATSAQIAVAPLPPSCDAGGPYAALVDEPVQFDGSGSQAGQGGPIVSYDWEFGDGSTGSGVMPIHTYGTYGSFTVTLTLVDELGAISECTAPAVIHAPPVCDSGGPYTAQVCTAISFDGSGSSDPDGVITSYAWEFGDGHGAGGAVVLHAYAGGGLYTVTLTVTDDSGIAVSCVTSADIDASHPPEPLSPVIGVDPLSLDFGCVDVGTCSESTIEILNDVVDPCSELEITGLTITGTGDVTFVSPPPVPVVLPGDGSTLQLTLRCCPTAPGPLSGALRIDSSNAANAPYEVPLTATGNTAPLCDAGPPVAGNAGEALPFDGSGSSDPGGTIAGYAWEFGDGLVGSGAMPTHVYVTGGLYTVTLTVADDCGATSECTTTADVNSLPVCDPGGSYYVEIFEPLVLDGSGSSDPDGSIIQYTWDFGDGQTGSGVTVTHIWEIGGEYTVTLCVTDDRFAEVCCGAHLFVDQPVPLELVRFEATSTDGTVELAWVTSPSHSGRWFDVERTPEGTGAGDVTVVNDAPILPRDGTTSDYTFTDRSVEPGATYRYRLVSIDPRTGEREHSQAVPVTVARVLPRRLVLHQNTPNPFNPSSTIRFELPAAGRVTLRVYDGSGRLIRTLVDAELARDVHRVTWDGRDAGGHAVGSGLYLYRLEAAGRVLQRKMVLLR
ncbi:MAG: PKD domain-containing protein [Candidatus Eiseniibacteriota bacterium]|jgi:PKD repeat protein